MNRFADIDWSFKRLPPVYGFYSEEFVSIEKALEPIEAQINGLSRYIKIAVKHCHFPNEHGLSKDQAAAIYIYTMDWNSTSLYRILNQALRSEDREDLKIWFPYLKLFDSAFDLLPTHTGALWRGVSLNIGKQFTKNQIFTWWSINSCSSSVGVIKKFLSKTKQSTIFLIEATNGKRVSGYTAYENEDEVILKFGTEFIVQGDAYEQSDRLILVHLKEIDDKEQVVNVKPSIQIQLKANLNWKPYAQTIAGGNREGDESNQLFWPYGIDVDRQQEFIYIADRDNHRIVQWKLGETKGKIVAGGNGQGNQIDQLNWPTDVIVDENNESLIICDHENRRVIRWSLKDRRDRQILIENISCWGLMMNENGDLFVSDWEKNEVKKWKKGEQGAGTLVAGGNGCGNQLNQFDEPRFIFVDQQETIYVSDCENHRVMKWMKGATEGIIVAGGEGRGRALKQLNHPNGLVVNEVGDVYVADWGNNRIICWPSDSRESRIVLGGNDRGDESNRFNGPRGLAFDLENNLYIVDSGNNRIQRFELDRR